MQFSEATLKTKFFEQFNEWTPSARIQGSQLDMNIIFLDIFMDNIFRDAHYFLFCKVIFFKILPIMIWEKKNLTTRVFSAKLN